MTENERLGKIAYEVRDSLEQQNPRHYDEDIDIPNPVLWEQLPAPIQARYIRVGAAVKAALVQESETGDTEWRMIAYGVFHESTVGASQAMPYWSELTSNIRFSYVSAVLAIKNAILGIHPLPSVIIDTQ